ncbi:MAG: methyltransferase domain-containing protein, partial [Pseudomonadota bacterium]
SASGVKPDWVRLGVDAARAGDYANAIDLFVTAISHDQRNAGLRYNLAIALERAGDIDDAAVSLSDALRIKPGMTEAAERLGRVLACYDIDEPGRIDPRGLMNALNTSPEVGEPVGRMLIRILRLGGPLRDVLEAGALEGFDQTAHDLVERRTAPLLRDKVFLRALACHTNMDVEVEQLLIALRDAIADLPAERFTDKGLVAFALALAAQNEINEHVHTGQSGDTAVRIDLNDVVAHGAKLSPQSTQAVLVALLHTPLEGLLRHATSQTITTLAAATLKPKSIAAYLKPRIARETVERDLASAIAAEADGALKDATSQRVAAQYEDRPYPRWTSFRRPPDGGLVRGLGRLFSPQALEFTSQPYDVLIAGCGTGRHALTSAIGYGANARVSAIDLSSRSLAYAQREAEQRGIRNVAFAQADLLDINAAPGPFDIIECVGVLHHLAHPLDGLDALLARLRPGGLIRIALYSAVSREDLSELRLEPDYPGDDCSDDAARTYRAALRDRVADHPGGELTVSHDFWTLSGFRDLVLHVSEQQFRLPQVRDALEARRLVFRGFNLHQQIIDEFMAANPGETFPGSLDAWWAYEQEHPRTFDAMYDFWAEVV